MLATILFVISILTFGAGLYKLFEKAGVPAWHAAVPGLNLIQICKITGRPTRELLWLFVPIVGLFKWSYMLVDLVNSFGRWGLLDQGAAIFTPFIYIPRLGFKPGGKSGIESASGTVRRQQGGIEEVNKEYCNYLTQAYTLKPEQRPVKGTGREWIESATFAIFAASFIRLFLIEPYNIPTPSMEGSMKVGDYLFVSKLHFGTRLPLRPLSLPMLHNVIPFFNTESYSDFVKWDYRRSPALTPLKRYDPTVFNFPEGDTIYQGADFSNAYYSLLYSPYVSNNQIIRRDIPALTRKVIMTPTLEERRRILQEQDYVVRPADKRDHYVKRCVAMPGDNMELRNKELYINGEKQQRFKYVQ